MKKAALIILLILFITIESKAQQVPLFNQYFNIPSLGYASSSAFIERPSMSFVYRGQWSGQEGSPSNLAFTYANQLKQGMGLNLYIKNNEIGLIRQSQLGLGASFKLLKKVNQKLALGAQANFSLFSANDEIINAESLNDLTLQNLLGSNGSAASLDLSLSYRFKGFGIDVVVPTVINKSISDDAYVQINEDNTPDYQAGAHYRFKVNEGVYFTPNITWRRNDIIGNEFDVTGRVEFKDRLLLSGGYRNNYGSTAGIGFRLNQNMLFTYHYDFGKSDTPMLSDGFNEIGIHLSLRRQSEKNQEAYTKGEALLQRVKDERIYDKNLIELEDQKLIEKYLYSLQTKGSKRKRRQAATQDFDAILNQIKEEETLRLKAEIVERQRQDAIRKAKVEEEREKEEARLRLEREKAEEEKRKVKEKTPEESPSARFAKATAEALAKLSPEERARVERINKLVRPEDLTEAYDLGDPRGIGTVDYQYVIVIASYTLDGKWSRIYLNSIKPKYPDAKIFASRKRGLDYVYVGGYDDYQQALDRMRSLRETSGYKDAWVHIIRLSR